MSEFEIRRVDRLITELERRLSGIRASAVGTLEDPHRIEVEIQHQRSRLRTLLGPSGAPQDAGRVDRRPAAVKRFDF